MASPELRAENWKFQPELFEKFQAGVLNLLDSNEWQRYLEYQRAFHRYSPGNVMLIMAQNPEATQIASMQTWNRQGRSVIKGEHGLKIWCPVPGRKVEQDEEGNETERKVTWFKLGTVFDVAQTQSKTGVEPPEPVRLIDSAPRPDLFTALNAVARYRGLIVQIVAKSEMHGANGYYQPDTRMIRLAEGLPEAMKVKTLAHELAHSVLHGKDFDYKAERPDAELQAESVAYLICGSQGLETDGYSFGYVASWASEQGDLSKVEVAERLLKSTKAIRSASEDLVKAVEEKLSPVEVEADPKVEQNRAVTRELVARSKVEIDDMAKRHAPPENAVDIMSLAR